MQRPCLFQLIEIHASIQTPEACFQLMYTYESACLKDAKHLGRGEEFSVYLDGIFCALHFP